MNVLKSENERKNTTERLNKKIYINNRIAKLGISLLISISVLFNPPPPARGKYYHFPGFVLLLLLMVSLFFSESAYVLYVLIRCKVPAKLQTAVSFRHLRAYLPEIRPL